MSDWSWILAVREHLLHYKLLDRAKESVKDVISTSGWLLPTDIPWTKEGKWKHHCRASVRFPFFERWCDLHMCDSKRTSDRMEKFYFPKESRKKRNECFLPDEKRRYSHSWQKKLLSKKETISVSEGSGVSGRRAIFTCYHLIGEHIFHSASASIIHATLSLSLSLFPSRETPDVSSLSQVRLQCTFVFCSSASRHVDDNKWTNTNL